MGHRTGESVSYKKAISGFFALLLRDISPKHQVVPFFRVFFSVYFHINAHDIKEKTMDVFKLIFVLRFFGKFSPCQWIKYARILFTPTVQAGKDLVKTNFVHAMRDYYI